jgi:hypothetical protein
LERKRRSIDCASNSSIVHAQIKALQKLRAISGSRMAVWGQPKLLSRAPT